MRLAGIAVLGDRAHAESEIGGVQLLVSGAQLGSHPGRIAGCQRGRFLVVPLLPREQERLHGRLYRGVRGPSADQHDSEDDDGARRGQHALRRDAGTQTAVEEQPGTSLSRRCDERNLGRR